MDGAEETTRMWQAIGEVQQKQSRWEDMMEWLMHFRNGNGHPPAETRFYNLETFVKSRRRIEWAAILALIAVVVGAAFNVGSYVAIAGIKATLENHVNKQQPHESGGGS